MCPLAILHMLSSKVFLEGQPNPSVSSVVKSERASVARTVDWNFLCGQLTGSVCKQLSRLLSSIVVDRVVLWTQRPWQSPSSDFCHPRNPCIVTLWYGVEFPLWSASTNWFSVCEQVQQAYRCGQIHSVDTETLAGISVSKSI